MAGTSVGQKQSPTPLAEMREDIHVLELGVRRLQGRKAGILDLLALRSRLEGHMAAHEETSSALRAERTRIETIDSILRREARAVVREAASAGGLEAARLAQSPPKEHWWWYLDRQVSEQRRARLVKTGTLVGGAAILLVVIGLVLNSVLGGDPAQKEAYSYAGAGEQAMRDGDNAAAISEYEKAVAAEPSLESAHVALGVLYALEGRTAESEEALATARALVSSEADLAMSLARAYQTAGEAETALVRAEEAVALAPESAQAYLTRAGIYEDLDQRAKALSDLELASTLAQEQGQGELAAMAKMRYGMLVQQVPADMFSGEPVTSTNATQE